MWIYRNGRNSQHYGKLASKPIKTFVNACVLGWQSGTTFNLVTIRTVASRLSRSNWIIGNFKSGCSSCETDSTRQMFLVARVTSWVLPNSLFWTFWGGIFLCSTGQNFWTPKIPDAFQTPSKLSLQPWEADWHAGRHLRDLLRLFLLIAPAEMLPEILRNPDSTGN